MSHKDAKPLSAEQERFERWYGERWKRESHAIAFGRDRHSEYFAVATKIAWEAWQEAQRPRATPIGCPDTTIAA